MFRYPVPSIPTVTVLFFSPSIFPSASAFMHPRWSACLSHLLCVFDRDFLEKWRAQGHGSQHHPLNGRGAVSRRCCFTEERMDVMGVIFCWDSLNSRQLWPWQCSLSQVLQPLGYGVSNELVRLGIGRYCRIIKFVTVSYMKMKRCLKYQSSRIAPHKERGWNGFGVTNILSLPETA